MSGPAREVAHGTMTSELLAHLQLA
jgi:hypothetical protein